MKADLNGDAGTVGGSPRSGRPPDPRAIVLRQGTMSDLEAVNRIVAWGVMGWRLPERVKRLSLPVYQYRAEDLGHLTLLVATLAETVVGVAAWEAAQRADGPRDRRALLLQGLYVDPAFQGLGVGRRLLDAAQSAARDTGFDGVLVKAQADAAGFFDACGLERLPVVDPHRDYPHRFWLPV